MIKNRFEGRKGRMQIAVVGLNVLAILIFIVLVLLHVEQIPALTEAQVVTSDGVAAATRIPQQTLAMPCAVRYIGEKRVAGVFYNESVTAADTGEKNMNCLPTGRPVWINISTENRWDAWKINAEGDVAGEVDEMGGQFFLQYGVMVYDESKDDMKVATLVIGI